MSRANKSIVTVPVERLIDLAATLDKRARTLFQASVHIQDAHPESVPVLRAAWKAYESSATEIRNLSMSGTEEK